MTLSEVVDLVLLNVGGGVLAEDSAVKRPDVEAYMPTLITAAFETWYTNESKEAMRLRKRFNFGINNYQRYSFDLADIKKDEFNNWYFDLPSSVYVINGDPLIYTVRTVKGFEYIKTSGSGLLDNIEFFYPISAGGTTRIILSLKPSCSLLCFAMCKGEALQVPEGPLYLAIDKATDHFRKQAQQPTEVNLDQTFVNDVNKPKPAVL